MGAFEGSVFGAKVFRKAHDGHIACTATSRYMLIFEDHVET
jgi:hypothetical protein